MSNKKATYPQDLWGYLIPVVALGALLMAITGLGKSFTPIILGVMVIILVVDIYLNRGWRRAAIAVLCGVVAYTITMLFF